MTKRRAVPVSEAATSDSDYGKLITMIDGTWKELRHDLEVLSGKVGVIETTVNLVHAQTSGLVGSLQKAVDHHEQVLMGDGVAVEGLVPAVQRHNTVLGDRKENRQWWFRALASPILQTIVISLLTLLITLTRIGQLDSRIEQALVSEVHASGEVMPTPTADPTPVPPATSTPTPSPIPAQWPSNGLPDEADTDREMLEVYYTPSPELFYGYATRYGSAEMARRELFFQIGHLREQLKVGFPLVGGGYGYKPTSEGDLFLVRNDADLAEYLEVAPDPVSVHELTEAQARLYLMPEDEDEFDTYVGQAYLGVVSLKSPNDIGRVFCLYNGITFRLKGKVIVGGTAALNDWTGIGPQTNEVPLGRRVLPDDRGGHISWAADLPDELYLSLLADNQALLLLVEDHPTGMCASRP